MVLDQASPPSQLKDFRIARPPSQTWRTFLRNHMKDTVAADFFMVPTIFFQVLFVFVINRK